MTAIELYSKLATHMLKGVMMHEQLANYYDFLGLYGYKKCHEYHFMTEMRTYRKVCRYVIEHHNVLIPDVKPVDPEVIPDSWYRYNRMEVDNTTRKNAVKNGLNTWVEWEKETKELYSTLYKQFLELDAVADACYIKCLVADVDEELKCAEQYQLTKESVNYELSHIIAEQHKKKEKYENKIKCWSEMLC